ncbi:S8 family peptidase [Clostridiaceae bacterium 35-E11]
MNKRQIRAKFVHPKVIARLSAGTKEYLSVIVYSQETCDHIRDCILDAGGKIKYDVPMINAIAAEIPASAVDSIAAHHMIQFINDDNKVFKCMDIATKCVAAQLVNDTGYTGKGIGIAVIDTGVAPHDDLIRPTNRIIAFKDFVNNRSQPYDDDGHGTHVAGIAAGNGYVNKKYKGIAPEANIIGVKVLDETGSGSTSDILAGIQWVIDHKDTYNIKVVNMSFGSPADKIYSEDPLAKAAAAAVQSGLTVVAAAGNSGPNARSITTPGTSPSVITVGAADDNRTISYEDDFIAEFSSRGPTLGGVVKPNVVAPGVDIMSLSNKNSTAYVSHSGTSMATPIVGGAAALLYEKNLELSPLQVKNKIVRSAINIDGNRFSEGSGIISIKNMLDLEDTTSPVAPTPKPRMPRRPPRPRPNQPSRPQQPSKPIFNFDPSLLALLFLFL